VRARWPHLDPLPEGGFVVARSRVRRHEDANQVQVFDALGPAVAVHGRRVAFYFYGGYGEEQDRLTRGEITEASVEPTDVGLLALPDGSAPGRRRSVARGSRIYVQAEPFTTWGVFDLSR
jgi:hypothetical protein